MWIRANPNPKKKNVPDCVIRAISITTGQTWYEVYDGLYLVGREECSVPNDDNIWGRYLYQMGFVPFLLPDNFPRSITVREFVKMFNEGTYIIGTGNHAIAVINGDYYDSWDSGGVMASFFWKIA
jgi:hypothetical protein